MKILVTAGPTREWIDDVRFLSNESTGRMGYAVAAEAVKRGHETILVTGKVDLTPPVGAAVVRVESAAEMHEACLRAFPGVDAAVMTAAVADYRPAERVAGKVKKRGEELVLRLVRNPDILKTLGRMRGRRTLVGFALEAAPDVEALAYAREKLVDKGADLIVLNRPLSFGDLAAHDVVLVTEREAVPLGRIEKARLSERILSFVENARGSTQGSSDGSSLDDLRGGSDQSRGPS